MINIFSSIKLLRRVNTLENELEVEKEKKIELEKIIKNKLYNNLIKTINAPTEIEQLKNTIKRQKSIIKELRNNKKGEENNGKKIIKKSAKTKTNRILLKNDL